LVVRLCLAWYATAESCLSWPGYFTWLFPPSRKATAGRRTVWGRRFIPFKSAIERTRCSELRIHFLQATSKRFNLLLEAHNHGFLLLVLSVLFEKLVQQHRVYLVVADAVRFSFFVSDHQIGIYLFYFLCNQAELRRAFGIEVFLVVEGNYMS
jgi:hypothetical protein